MKRLLFLCLLVAGCSGKKSSLKTYDPTGAVPMVQFQERELMVSGSLWFCTNDNHRFAITVTTRGVAVCEVTDASLIRSNFVPQRDYVADSNYVQGFADGSKAWQKIVELEKK